jgi:hypothetical protein
MGVGAYKAHESASEIRSEAASAEAIYHQPALTAELEGLAHTKDLQTIVLLGGTVLLGAGTAAGYRAAVHDEKARLTTSHNARLENRAVLNG